MPLAQRSSLRNLTPFISCVLAVAVFLLWIAFVRLPAREQYFTQHYLRVAGALRDQLESALNGGLSGLSELGPSSAKGDPVVGALKRIQSSLRIVEMSRCRGWEDNNTRRFSEGRSSSILVEHGSSLIHQETLPPRWDSSDAGIGSGIKTTANIVFRVDFAPDQKSQRRSTPIVAGGVLPASATTAPMEGYSDRTICAAAPLQDLLESAFRDPSFGGLEIFIANGRGEIIFQRGPASIRLERLPSPKPTPKAKSTPQAKSQDEDSQRKVSLALPEAEEVRQQTIVRKVEVGELEYRSFIQPLALPLLSGDSGETKADHIWAVGILVPERQFEREVRWISFGSLTNLPLLFALAFCLAPLTKIFLIGQRSRLHGWDLYFAVFGLMLASGVVAVLIDSKGSAYRIDNALDAELRAWSEKIRSSFTQEVLKASAGLDTFASYVRDRQPREQSIVRLFDRPLTRGRRGTITRIEKDYPYLDLLIATDLGDSSADDVGPSIATSIAFEPSASAQAVNDSPRDVTASGSPAGAPPDREQQWLKWTPNDVPTPFLRRSVFKESFEHRWKNRFRVHTEREHSKLLLLSSLRSPTTGRILTLIERQVQSGQARRSVAMVPDLITLKEAVSPASFGFAVIESGGKVVFHSRPERNLVENFLAEVDAEDELAAAMSSHHERWVDTSYHGRNQRMYIHPLGDTSWTLVVYRDREGVRATLVDALVTWFSCFLVYACAAGVVFWLLMKILPPHDTAWFWLDPRRQRAYWATAVLMAIYLLAGAYTLVGAAHADPSATVFCAIVLPFAGCTFVIAAQVYGAFLDEDRSRWCALAKKSPRRFCLFVVAALLCALGHLLILAFAAHWLTCLLTVATLIAAVACGRPACGDSYGRARYGYLATATLMIAVAGVLPSLALFRDSLNLGVEVMIRHGQRRLADELAARTLRIRNDPRRTIRKSRLKADWDLPPRGLLWQGGPRYVAEPCHISPPCAHGEGAAAKILYALVASHCAATTFEPYAGGCCENYRCDRDRPRKPPSAVWSLVQQHLTGLVMANLPTWDRREAIERRDLVYSEASDGSWRSTPESVHRRPLAVARHNIPQPKIGSVCTRPIPASETRISKGGRCDYVRPCRCQDGASVSPHWRGSSTCSCSWSRLTSPVWSCAPSVSDRSHSTPTGRS